MHTLGLLGENIATAILESRGYKILGRNIHTPHGEIDILAVKKGILVAIEVRTRSKEGFGTLLESMHPTKVTRVHHSLLYIAQREKKVWRGLQIDFMGLLIIAGKLKDVVYVENIA